MRFDRRTFLKTLASTGALLAAACETKHSEPRGSARPAAWEPVDPAFTGCEGG